MLYAVSCCIDVLLHSGRGTVIVRCIASSTAIQHDFSYSRLYSAEALGTAHGGTDTAVGMVAWEPIWVRVTPHTSHMARVTQKTIGKRQTSISGALWLPSRWLRPWLSSAARSAAIHHKKLLYWAIQRTSPVPRPLRSNTALQHDTACSNTSLYTLQHSTIPQTQSDRGTFVDSVF